MKRPSDHLAAFGLALGLALALSAAPALAAPPVQPGSAGAASEDDLGRLLAERGLIGTLGQAGLAVRNQTSELVLNAMGFLGVPYKRGGTTVETGFDCSGFVRAIFEQTAGMVLPRRAKEQAAATEVIDKRDLKPGDLVFFNTMKKAFSHVGIYVGDGKFIHAPKPGAEVRVEDMAGSYWVRRFDGARRVLTSAPAADIATSVAR
jgi:hypothetical protein